MNEEKPNYYAVIPSTVRYDEELSPNEKLIYGEITALSNKNNECWATNNYFAQLYNVKIQSVSRWIKHLKDKKYIDVQLIYKNSTKEIEKRIIKINGVPINKKVNTYTQKSLEGINKNVKGNNTSINNKENIYKRKIFTKPSIEEIYIYCQERNNGIDAEYFYDFYESKDWMIGKNKMKDWKSCIRTWERKNKSSSNKSTTKRYL